MSFKEIKIQTEYRSLPDDIINDFYIPVLEKSILYKRAVGFFSSSALVEISKGICQLVKNGGKIQLIASPYLSEEDIDAIKEGYEKKETIIEKRLISSLFDPKDEIEAQRLNFLSNLIALDIINIKIAFLDNGNDIGIYHEKVGLMYDNDDNVIAFTGSMNESKNGFRNNFETIDVYCSWLYEEHRVKAKHDSFEAMWNNNQAYLETIEFSKLKESIIEKYRYSDHVDLNLDRAQFYYKKVKNLKEFIRQPDGVMLRPYQIEAIDNWENNGFVGIFDMATGSGKTFTALGALERLYQRLESVAVIIVCPYIHLVDQWAEDLLSWGMNPIIAHSQSKDKKWGIKFQNAYRRFKSTKKSFVCITTNDTFKSEKIQSVLKYVKLEMNYMLIVDEVHNFGAKQLSDIMPEQIKYRLGLSATIRRHMDKEGTNKIIQYFGKKCIEYSLKRAIDDGALVEYEYYPILLSLTDCELREYQKLTRQISKQIIEENGKKKITDFGMQLIFKRSRLVAGAEDKIPILKDLLNDGYREKSHILVYCGATRGFEHYRGENDRQIERIGKMIGSELGMSTHKFTAEEDAEMRRLLQKGFANGEFQVITAIKCLDEGVNIPNIQYAFILASSRNPKEFIQRRGRVLRRAPGKQRAIIYDFVTLPRSLGEVVYSDFEEDKSLVIGEMARVYEFGKYAINQRIAYQFLDDIQDAYAIDLFYDDLLGYMEEEYGEED